MDLPKVEAAFLIYNLEYYALINHEKLYTIKELNKKINKYAQVILSSNYKHVNNFSYTTEILHYFYKITEYYFMKYFNSTIIDSTFFFKCINDIKNRSFDIVQNDEMKKQFNLDENKGTQKSENLTENLGENLENKKVGNYSFNCKVLHSFVENLKRICSENRKHAININEIKRREEKREKSNSRNNISNNNNNGINSETHTRKAKKTNETKHSEEHTKFHKRFYYELCEINGSHNNEKNRMIYITKIFRKIINRKKVRQFICENEKRVKKNNLKFFLNLSLGIFIYLYIYKYIKKNYKKIEFFIFLNNLQNIRKIYLNNMPYIEKRQLCNFIKYIKLLNIQMFQYVYISFFVNIYKYANLIYNVTLLTLFNYFKHIYENNIEKKKGLQKNENQIIDTNDNMCKSFLKIDDTKCKEINNDSKNYVEVDENFSNKIILSKEKNIQIKEEQIMSSERGKGINTNTYECLNKIIDNNDSILSSDLNKKKGENVTSGINENTCNKIDDNTSPSNGKQNHNSFYSIENKREQTNEIIFDCYIYVFILFTYIRKTRNRMKSKMIKIQNNIKKMISIFVKIYYINQKEKKEKEEEVGVEEEEGKVEEEVGVEEKEGKVEEEEEAVEERKKSLRKYIGNKKHVRTNFDESSCKASHNIVNSLPSLYFNYIELSKYYKSCIKINYEIMNLVHKFHLLLKHFYKYLPVLNINKENCIIYNYYNKCYIYNENIKKKEDTDKVIPRKDIYEKRKKKETTFNIFKNVTDYELDFFYFNEKEHDEKEIIHDLVQNNEVELFEHVFEEGAKNEFANCQSSQSCTEQQDAQERENSDNGLSSDEMEYSKKLFLYYLNNNLEMCLINLVDKDEFSSANDEAQNGGNTLTTSYTKTKNLSFLKSTSILQYLNNNKNTYNKIIEIIHQFYNNPSHTLKNCIKDLNIYDKNILEIYDDNIFDLYYKFKNEATFETEESIKNKKLLEVKIFLDYEKLHTKRTVETQTPISFFKKDKLIQIAKDEEVSTIAERSIQTKKITNPIFYLKDIYD
ncbi:conserved Plasmodium protein, unknown function [Plasmodium malariae]|uniref:Uncharacterized protein n=1 Tax=Plasmodium malariae TaxID=5858 RepID=A0A1D3TEI0_PLAMA|nr:conserved Plasmodium protein, unknown function [Plasmodium malariae]SCP03331.1 conserved Plasmodium protein, unknown function [Plasmodium malariae]